MKIQRFEHERIERIEDLEGLGPYLSVPVPRVLARGEVRRGERTSWWVKLTRLEGAEDDTAAGREERMRAIGRTLAEYHRAPCLSREGGLSTPQGMGIFWGTVVNFYPDAYPELAGRLLDAIAGLPVTAIHGDLSSFHNSLFCDGRMAGLLDPGGVPSGPPEVDVAWAAAMEIAAGFDPGPLLDAYDRPLDGVAFSRILALLLVRRLTDMAAAGAPYGVTESGRRRLAELDAEVCETFSSLFSPPQKATPLAPPKKRLLIVGDAVAATGFSRVLRGIFEPLADRYEIHQLAVNYDGDPHSLPWKLYPAASHGMTYGQNRLVPLIQGLQPDAIFLLNDLWILAGYMDVLGDLSHEVPVVLYSPIESGPVDPALVRRLSRARRLLLYTELARREVREALSILREEEGPFDFPPVDVLPHGIDTQTFFPLHENLTQGYSREGRARLREIVYPQNPELANAFIVLNANRNQPRKRIDITLRGFALFAKDKPEDVRLHLHMGLKDIGWDLRALGKRLGIEDRLIFSAMTDGLPSLPDENLNYVYNACDVGLNTAAGEGWGLVSFEHAATGAAQVVPGYSAPGELWRGAAELLPASQTLVQPETLTEEGVIAPETVAAALDRLYRDHRLLDEMSRAAYHNAVREEYRWSEVAHRYEQYLNSSYGAPQGDVAFAAI